MLESLKKKVREGGFRVSSASGDFGATVYAASIETVPGCYGHPRYEVMYDRETGWLSETGKPPVRLHRAPCCGEHFTGDMNTFYASHDCPNCPIPQEPNRYADANGFCPIDAEVA